MYSNRIVKLSKNHEKMDSVDKKEQRGGEFHQSAFYAYIESSQRKPFA
jgi:hypothetical protein